MPTLRVPALLKYYLDDQTEVRLEGQTVIEILDNLSQKFPQIRSHIFDPKGQVRRHINLFVNADNIRDLNGLETEVGESDIIKILPSVTGG
jgi:molybdopterin converting factor small subunit